MISGHQINGQNNAKTWDCDWGCLFGGQIHTVIWGRGLQKEWNPLVSLTVKLTSLGETWQLQRQNAWLKEVGDFVHNQRVRPRHWPQDLTLKKLYFSCESTQDCQESIAKFALIYRYPTCLDSECWRHILKLPPKLLVRLIDWSRKKFVWLVYVIFKYAWRLSAMFRSKPRSLDAFAAQ